MTKGKTFRERVHAARQHVRFLTVEEAKEIIERRGATVIDVGEAWQLADGAQFPGRRTFPGVNSTSGPIRSCRAVTRHFRTAR